MEAVERMFLEAAVQHKTKREQRDHFRRILHGAELNTPLQGNDLEDVLTLILRHPDYVEKYGCGIRSIVVRNNPIFYKTKGFWIIRTDGSETDVSYLRCIDGCDKPIGHWIHMACRAAIEMQVVEFKREAFRVSDFATCKLTGQSVTWGQCHVDHASPLFRELVASFFESHPVDLSDSLFYRHGDGDCSVQFADRALTERWQHYHRVHANLRIVTVQANLRRKKSQQGDD
jgi:hypothetical protein